MVKNQYHCKYRICNAKVNGQSVISADVQSHHLLSRLTAFQTNEDYLPNIIQNIRH